MNIEWNFGFRNVIKFVFIRVGYVRVITCKVFNNDVKYLCTRNSVKILSVCGQIINFYDLGGHHL